MLLHLHMSRVTSNHISHVPCSYFFRFWTHGARLGRAHPLYLERKSGQTHSWLVGYLEPRRRGRAELVLVPVVQGLVVRVTGVTGLGRLAAQRGLVSRTEDQVPSLEDNWFTGEEIYEFYKRARPAIPTHFYS